MTHVLFINGPPRSGKDTLARALAEKICGARVSGFAHHLKRATHAAYGLWSAIDDPYAFEKCKDQARVEFFGLTPREAYIAHSERYLKPLHNPFVFGAIFARQITMNPDVPLWIIPDSGFRDEAKPVIELAGAKRCALIRMRREGKTFDGDSRSYIDLSPVPSLDIDVVEGRPERATAVAEGFLRSVFWRMG